MKNLFTKCILYSSEVQLKFHYNFMSFSVFFIKERDLKKQKIGVCYKFKRGVRSSTL